MPIALITDLHFGARNNSPQFDNYFRKFYTDIFFPYLLKNNISDVICLGDTFDVRKNTNSDILNNCKEYFFDIFEKHEIHLTMLVGNHDAYFKDTLKVNSPRILLKEYKNITIIDKPEVLNFGESILMMPWICRDNVEESLKLLEESNARYCFGHFEIAGFKMYKNTESHGGFESVMFNKYDKVFSGHYHTRSTQGNITYLGCPYQMNWADYDDPKGFHIFEPNTGELEFIQNPLEMFVVHEYNENTTKVPDIKDKIVRIQTQNIENKVKFDKWIADIQAENPSDIKIVDQNTVIKVEEANEEEIASEDTVSVLSYYVDSIQESLKESNLDKERLKKMLSSLYKEASEL